MDALLIGTLVVLFGGLALAALAVLAIDAVARPRADELVTEIGATTQLPATTDPQSPACDAATMLRMVPLRRTWNRERDIEQFLRDAEGAEAAARGSLAPAQIELIEAVQRVRRDKLRASRDEDTGVR